MVFPESERELLQKSHFILERVVIYTEELAKTEGELNLDTVIMLLKTLVSDNTSNGSKNHVTLSVLQVLQPRERLAVMFAQYFCNQFNKIVNTNDKKKLQDLNEKQVGSSFFVNLSKTVQRILDSQGPFATEVLSGMTKTIDAYLNLYPLPSKD